MLVEGDAKRGWEKGGGVFFLAAESILSPHCGNTVGRYGFLRWDMGSLLCVVL